MDGSNIVQGSLVAVKFGWEGRRAAQRWKIQSVAGEKVRCMLVKVFRICFLQLLLRSVIPETRHSCKPIVPLESLTSPLKSNRLKPFIQLLHLIQQHMYFSKSKIFINKRASVRSKVKCQSN